MVEINLPGWVAVKVRKNDEQWLEIVALIARLQTLTAVCYTVYFLWFMQHHDYEGEGEHWSNVINCNADTVYAWMAFYTSLSYVHFQDQQLSMDFEALRCRGMVDDII